MDGDWTLLSVAGVMLIAIGLWFLFNTVSGSKEGAKFEKQAENDVTAKQWLEENAPSFPLPTQKQTPVTTQETPTTSMAVQGEGTIQNVHFTERGIFQEPATVFEIHTPNMPVFYAILVGHVCEIRAGAQLRYWTSFEVKGFVYINETITNEDGTKSAITSKREYYNLDRFQIL